MLGFTHSQIVRRKKNKKKMNELNERENSRKEKKNLIFVFYGVRIVTHRSKLYVLFRAMITFFSFFF